MSDGKNECGIYPVGNKSDPYHLGNVYGGIPTNLITNYLGWMVLKIMFILIRKSAFKYLKLESIGDLFTNTERNMNRLLKVYISSNKN